MSRRNAFTAGGLPGRGRAGRGAHGGSGRQPQQGRRALRLIGGRRDDPASAMTCPYCGLPSRDPVEARVGYCPRCRTFTGLCGAGRKVVCPDIVTNTSWHLPCTSIGAVAWEITLDKSPVVVLVCRVHDAQLRAGGATWIKHARRLAGAADPGPAQIYGLTLAGGADSAGGADPPVRRSPPRPIG